MEQEKKLDGYIVENFRFSDEDARKKGVSRSTAEVPYTGALPA